ncbi:MAG: hypothetical protein WDO15_22730 [Bacteroidota bacterium]
MNNKDPRVKTLNPKIGGPIALILVVGFAVIFIYGWRKGKSEDKEYLTNPKIHDIYYTKDDMKRYSVMELVDIKGDEILIQKGDFTVRDKKQLHDKEWTFSPAVWIKMSELQRMYDADEITSITRPKGEN